MKKICLIIQREYLVNVRKRSFILLTLFAPFLFVLFSLSIVLIGQANSETKTIAVLDKSQWFEKSFTSNDILHFEYITPSQQADVLDSIKIQHTYDALLVIETPTDDFFSNASQAIQLFVSKSFDSVSEKYLQDECNRIISSQRMSSLGLSKEQMIQFEKSIKFSILNISDTNKNENSEVKFFLGSALAYIVFMFIMIHGVRVMRSVVEEKNNRIIEVIISSVKPIQLMLGKIIGNGLVALTQFLTWVGLFFVLSSFITFFLTDSVKTSQLNNQQLETIIQYRDLLFDLNYPFIILTFLLFFILGFLLFASIFSAIGAAVDSEAESQQFTMIVVLPLMIGGYGSFSSLMTNPDGSILTFLSIFPLTSPVAMVIRSPYEVPLYQWIIAVFLLIVVIYLIVQLAAKIYRIGILMHGNKINIKELWKWIRM